MTIPRDDDLATPPAGAVAGADPLAVFRHDALPSWALVRHRLDPTEIEDVDAAVDAAVATMADRLPPAGRACVAVGSRGIDRIADVARATVTALRAHGLDVFAVPAMGSHGGATAAGQRAVLASLGIREDTIGCEIRSSMDWSASARLQAGCRCTSTGTRPRRPTSSSPSTGSSRTRTSPARSRAACSR
jgi:hypothetical protein